MKFKSRLEKGIKWTSYETILSALIQFLQNVILARILSPSDFGFMALILIVLGFIQPLFDFGLGTAVIQSKDLNHNKLSTLYWLNVILGIGCFLLTLLSSLFSELFFSQPELTPAIMLSGSIFLIAPWGSLHAALIAKDLRLEVQAKISISCVLIALILSIGLALCNYGLYALLYAFIARSLCGTLLHLYYGRALFRPSLVFDVKSTLEQLKFGLFETGSSFINYFSANIDKILIGNFLGPHFLGLYTQIWKLVLLPLKRINPIIRKITFPLYSKFSSRSAVLNRYYQDSLMIVLIISFPIFLFFGLAPKVTLQILFGSQWVEAEGILRILSVVGIWKCLANPGGGLLLALGRADIKFYWNIGWSATIFIFVIAGLFISPTIEAVACAQLAAAVLVGPIWHILIVKITKVKYDPILKSLWRFLMLGAIVFVLFKLIDLLVQDGLVLNVFGKLGVMSLVLFLFVSKYLKSYLLLLYRILRI